MEPGRDLGHVAETRGDLGVGVDPRADHLERHQAIERGLSREVDHSHGPRPEDIHHLEPGHGRQGQAFCSVRSGVAPIHLCPVWRASESAMQAELPPQTFGEFREPPAELLEPGRVGEGLADEVLGIDQLERGLPAAPQSRVEREVSLGWNPLAGAPAVDLVGAQELDQLVRVDGFARSDPFARVAEPASTAGVICDGRRFGRQAFGACRIDQLIHDYLWFDVCRGTWKAGAPVEPARSPRADASVH
jgi:hypothetical protein